MHKGFSLRLGMLPKTLVLRRPVWIHAVSVGETIAVRGLWRRLKQEYPLKEFLISTITPTGNKIARRMAGDSDYIIYLPLDFGFVVKKVIDKINPSIFIITETEIWPNLIAYLHRKKIPIVVVNGRISDASYSGYLCMRFLIKPILNKVSIFCMRSKRDADRLLSLGVSKDKIQVTGNMKFDIRDEDEKAMDYRALLNLRADEKIFLAGSTHTGEEEIILRAYKSLLLLKPGLRLVIAPRHVERAGKIEGLIIKQGFNPTCISQLMNHEHRAPYAEAVFILDTVGNLASFYSIADVVFVGGSLINKGGHNILEPAARGKSVLFGPYMSNFQDIADLFLENKVGIMVRDEEGLKIGAKELLDNPKETAALGEKARELISANQGATRLNAEQITKLI